MGGALSDTKVSSRACGVVAGAGVSPASWASTDMYDSRDCSLIALNFGLERCVIVNQEHMSVRAFYGGEPTGACTIAVYSLGGACAPSC